MKRLVIFDLDGTIADTSPGIFGGVRHAQKTLGLPEITPEQMNSFVGPPNEESYEKNFGLSGERLREAVRLHREYAVMKGYREIKIYDGIPELLRELREKGVRTAVATLKAQATADKIFKEFGLDVLFDAVVGTYIDNPMKKSDMLLECMSRLACEKPDAVLIGDSRYDADAAEEAGIDFIAVTYGFGFRTSADVGKYIACCDSVSDLKKCF